MGRQAYWYVAFVLCLLPMSTGARSFRVAQVPNGATHGCLTCHTGNGGPRNAFGIEIQNGFLSVAGSTGSVLWGPPLAALDSDEDGLTNGEELLDALGAWTVGDPDPPELSAVLTGPGSSDTDGDGSLDGVDLCPDLSNPDQIDTDGDGQGNACDADDDEDGLLDSVETDTGIFVSASDTGSNPLLFDTDRDNWDDEGEVFFGSDPNDSTSSPSPGTGKFVLPAGVEGDAFGISVALASSGDDALIAANGRDTPGGFFAGTAYVYSRESDGFWSLGGALLAPDSAADDNFGVSVALSSSGDTAIVGADLDDTDAGVDSGSAWIFTRAAGEAGWSPQQQILDLSGGAGDGFGAAVALSSSGDMALIGAYQADTVAGGADSGSASVYTRAEDGSWSSPQFLETSDAAAGDAFGVSVALSASGDTAILGADLDDTPMGANAGSAWVFGRAADGTWSPQSQLLAGDGSPDDGFGYRVALSSDGNTALVGAYADQVGEVIGAGSAYVFVRDAQGGWSQQQQLLAPVAAENDAFGIAVSLSPTGDRALVGAYFRDGPAGIDSGSAYLFKRNATGLWSLDQELTAPDGDVDDSFGGSVALSLHAALVGADLSDTAADFDTGSAYLFELASALPDADGDGFDDEADNCPDTANPGQEDFDFDGMGDACDLDDDGDGTPDVDDAFPLDASETLDSDEDGTGNNADLDDDNDGFSDSVEATLGTDALDAASVPSTSDPATFAAFGGYTAYLADPNNSDLFAAGVCDETAAFEHWRDNGFGEGRGFADGQLRTDNPDGSPDPDYAIDGGFSWEYPGANTVVFITADAPKPEDWDGRFLLLERCQTFNIGSHYTAQAYRTINVDVAQAIDGGLIPGFASVTDHYVKYGFKEGRLTNSDWAQAELEAWVDADYFVHNGDVQTYFEGAQSEGWVAFGKIGFAHYINFGRYEGRNDGQLSPPPTSFNLAEIASGRPETATRYLVEAAESANPDTLNADAPPSFGGHYVTPFNTELTPVGPQSNINHFYSQLQAFSYDSVYVMLSEDLPNSNSSLIVIRRVADFSEVISSPVGEWGNPRWHPADPSKLVHFDSNTDDTTLLLQSTDVETGVTTTLFEFPAEYQRYLGNQSFDELSRDGQWIAGQAVGVGDWSRIFSLNIETGSLGAVLDPAALYAGLCTPDPEFGPVDPDWIGVSPLGNYLIVQWAASGVGRCQGLETFDITTGAYLGHVTDGHPHADLTVLADGVTEVFVTNELTGPSEGQTWTNGEAAGELDSGYPALSYRTLPGSATGEADVQHLYLIDWGGFEHISCRGPFGYCVVTGFASPENGARDPLEDEIYIIRLDGSGVTRIAHHHSSGADYWSQPKASMSADGRYIIFDSDWGLQDATMAYLIDLARVPNSEP